MTDARLNSEWLGALRFDELSDAAWRVFCGALMWSNGSGTDGVIPTRYVARLHPDGDQPAAFAELVTAGLWEKTEDGYVMTGWEGALGQSTSAQVETYKENARQRAAKYRERERQKMARSLGLISDGVTGDVTSDVTRDVGKAEARPGTGSVVPEGQQEEKPAWPVAAIPQGVTCEVCTATLPEGFPLSVCTRQDEAHTAARAALGRWAS